MISKALSIRQPWAWLIVNGHKDIENRSWKTGHRGPILVHASTRMTREDYDEACRIAEIAFAMNGETVEIPAWEDLERGGIVGQVNIAGCVNKSPSPWFFGEFGFVLEDAKPMPFRKVTGKLGFFNVDGGEA